VWRVRAMIVAGLLTILGALAPLVIRQFDVTLAFSWQLSAALLGLSVLAQLVFAARGSRPLTKEKLISPVRFEWVLAVVSVALAGALGALSLGFLGGSIQAIYSLGLLYLLGLSAHHFFNLILAAQPAD
jgi:hypothetical protein